MTRVAMPPLHQPPHLTEHDVRYLLERMAEHPRCLNIDGHQPFTSTHLEGYLTTLEQGGYLEQVRTVIVGHASFGGALLDNLVRLPRIRRLELVVNEIHGPIDLMRVNIRRLVLVDNDIDTPNRECHYLRLSPRTERVFLYGKNIPKRELKRLRGYPGLQVQRKRR